MMEGQTEPSSAAAPAPESTGSVDPKRRRILIALSLLPFLVLASIHWRVGPILDRSDYAQYLLHADALLHGRAYTDIGFIFSPYAPFAGPEAYPPGLPLTLVPLLAAFGRDATVLKLFAIGCVVAWLWCAARYLEGRTGLWIACGAVMMTGVAVENSFATNVVNSDLGFAALIWALLLVADARGHWTFRRSFAVLLLGTAAMSYRVVGIAAVPALLVFAISRWRKGGQWAAAPVLVWLVVAALTARALPITTQYSHTVVSDPSSLPSRVEQNIKPAKVAVLEAMLYPLPGDQLNDIYHAVALLIAGIGAVAFLRKHGMSYLGCFVVCYTGLLLIAPAAVARYWWPLFPLIAAWLLMGVERIGRLAPRASRVVLRAPIAIAVAVSVGAVAISAARPAPSTLPENADMQALFATLRNAPDKQNLRVYFVSPRVLTLETGIAGMPFLRVSETELLVQLRGNAITHVVSGDLGTGRQAQHTLTEAIASNPRFFEPVYRNETFTLYRFLGR